MVPAVSLGSTDTLIQHPAGLTHRCMSDDAKASSGISPSLLRLSVGLEDPMDLWADLDQALETAHAEATNPPTAGGGREAVARLSRYPPGSRAARGPRSRESPMAYRIRRVEYFHATVVDEPGEAYKVLSALAGLGVNLVAFTAVPVGPDRTQLTVFPEDPGELKSEAHKAGMALDGPPFTVDDCTFIS